MTSVELKNLKKREEFKSSLLISHVMPFQIIPFQIANGREIGVRTSDGRLRIILEMINGNKNVKHKIEAMILDEMQLRAGTFIESRIREDRYKWNKADGDPIDDIIMGARMIRSYHGDGQKMAVIAGSKAAELIDKCRVKEKRDLISITINDQLLPTIHGMPVIRVEEHEILDNIVFVAVIGDYMGAVFVDVADYLKTMTFKAKALVFRPEMVLKIETGIA